MAWTATSELRRSILAHGGSHSPVGCSVHTFAPPKTVPDLSFAGFADTIPTRNRKRNILLFRNLQLGTLALVASLSSALMSAAPAPAHKSERQVYLFPSASDSLREGFVRVINRSAESGRVTIHPTDDAGYRVDAVTLSINANETRHFNSGDLETGNADKGLSGGTGAGEGDWRLSIESDLDIEVLSYVRTEDGFLTSMHDVVPGTGTRHRVAVFNPASNRNQRSLLRLVVPGPQPAEAMITGTDDRGVPGAQAVTLSVAGGGSRTVGAEELESGGEDLEGMLGDGSGKWQLTLISDVPVVAMSLLLSPTGHLTNLSTAPARGLAPPSPPPSYELQKTGLHVDRQAIRQVDTGREALAVAYGDFDGDGDEDVFLASYDATEEPTPVEFYANDGNGEFALANEIFDGDVPELVHPRKALPGDFNGDGQLDVFIAGHGYDQEPFPGESPVLLLSSDGGLKAADGLENWVGFFHGAASADVDYDGDLDVVLTDFGPPILLKNNGVGEFTEALDSTPDRRAFTTELIDVDDDGFIDLLLAGHENDNPTEIYWGNRSRTYIDAKRTVLPAVPGQDTVVDIDADDLDGDGVRDIVVTRTGGGDNFYQGYYIQLIRGLGNREFVDATVNVKDAQSSDPWIDWIRLQDFDGDGHRDIVVDDAAVGVIWLNDGTGRFQQTTGGTVNDRTMLGSRDGSARVTVSPRVIVSPVEE